MGLSTTLFNPVKLLTTQTLPFVFPMLKLDSFIKHCLFNHSSYLQKHGINISILYNINYNIRKAHEKINLLQV